MTIQVKVIEHFFHVVQFITLYDRSLTFESRWNLSVTIPIKAIVEENFQVELFAIKYFANWNFDSFSKIVIGSERQGSKYQVVSRYHAISLYAHLLLVKSK